jgi:hypothetical protein
MCTLPLRVQDGHLFIELADGRWLLDTGAPASFSDSPDLLLAGKRFQIANNYCGLTPASLSKYVGVDCEGLLGADVLNCFDFIFDVPSATAIISTDELTHAGQSVRLDHFMGVPIMSVKIRNHVYRMFFDTGAQISYLHDRLLTDVAEIGSMTDFYPGFGQFQTKIHNVEVSLGGLKSTLCCGVLPSLLAATLVMADAAGIVGNQIIADRTVGYFPRRRLLAL